MTKEKSIEFSIIVDLNEKPVLETLNGGVLYIFLIQIMKDVTFLISLTANGLV